MPTAIATDKPFGRGPTNNAETQEPMKIRFVEILSFILILLTIAAGVLTLPESQVLPQGWLKFVPFVLGGVIAFKNGIYIYLDWLDDGQFNKSYKLPPGLSVVVGACLCLCLVSCATRPDGTKTFAGLDAVQWGSVAVKSGSSYLDQRKTVPAVTGAKEAANVTPPEEPSWFDLGLSLFGF